MDNKALLDLIFAMLQAGFATFLLWGGWLSVRELLSQGEHTAVTDPGTALRVPHLQ